MPTEITRLVDDLVAQMRSRSGPGYRQAMRRLGEAARAGGPETATAVIEALAPWLRGLQGDYAKTAVLVGACVEWGGSPMALVDVLPHRASEAMMLNAALPEFCTFGMGVGRVFEHMTPTLELDRVLEPAQTQLWFDRVALVVENDLMAG